MSILAVAGTGLALVTLRGSLKKLLMPLKSFLCDCTFLPLNELRACCRQTCSRKRRVPGISGSKLQESHLFRCFGYIVRTKLLCLAAAPDRQCVVADQVDQPRYAVGQTVDFFKRRGGERAFTNQPGHMQAFRDIGPQLNQSELPQPGDY